MKTKFRTIQLGLCSVLAAALTGCASPREYSHVSSQFPQIPTGEGRIVFYRGNELSGSGQWQTIWVNGALIGYLSSDSFFYEDRPAGDYGISGRAKGFLNITLEEKPLVITLKANETKYIRFRETNGLEIKIIPSLEDSDSAMKVLPKCLYFEGKYHLF